MSTKVNGPYYNKTRRAWDISWDSADGTKKSFSRKLKAEVLARKAQLEDLELPDEAPQPDRFTIKGLPEFGTPEFFKAAFACSELALREAHNRGDRKAIAEVRQYISGLTDISNAWVPHSGYLALEAQMDAVLDYLERTGHLTRSEGAKELQPQTPQLAGALRAGAGPDDAISGHDVAVPGGGRQPPPDGVN